MYQNAMVFCPLEGVLCSLLQKLEPDSAMPVIKQERPDDSCVPAGGARCLGSMQKVPSLSDLSDPESSLGEYSV
jgi:hypothetical protein